MSENKGISLCQPPVKTIIGSTTYSHLNDVNHHSSYYSAFSCTYHHSPSQFKALLPTNSFFLFRRFISPVVVITQYKTHVWTSAKHFLTVQRNVETKKRLIHIRAMQLCLLHTLEPLEIILTTANKLYQHRFHNMHAFILRFCLNITTCHNHTTLKASSIW